MGSLHAKLLQTLGGPVHAYVKASTGRVFSGQFTSESPYLDAFLEHLVSLSPPKKVPQKPHVRQAKASIQDNADSPLDGIAWISLYHTIPINQAHGLPSKL